jgi:hypothetical protein
MSWGIIALLGLGDNITIVSSRNMKTAVTPPISCWLLDVTMEEGGAMA